MMDPAFNMNTAHAILPVDPPDIPSAIQAEAMELGLLPKEEHHITLIGGETAVRIVDDVIAQKDPDTLMAQIRDIVTSYSYEYTPCSEYYLLERT